MGSKRLTAGDIAVMRQSLGMADHLPPDQVRWLLDEAQRMVTDRDRLEELTSLLRGPWRDVRVALNELHRLTGG